jgi:hypothetical protein
MISALNLKYNNDNIIAYSVKKRKQILSYSYHGITYGMEDMKTYHYIYVVYALEKMNTCN